MFFFKASLDLTVTINNYEKVAFLLSVSKKAPCPRTVSAERKCLPRKSTGTVTNRCVTMNVLLKIPTPLRAFSLVLKSDAY